MLQKLPTSRVHNLTQKTVWQNPRLTIYSVCPDVSIVYKTGVLFTWTVLKNLKLVQTFSNPFTIRTVHCILQLILDPFYLNLIG